jgi:hypothetical protein
VFLGVNGGYPVEHQNRAVATWKTSRSSRAESPASVQNPLALEFAVFADDGQVGKIQAAVVVRADIVDALGFGQFLGFRDERVVADRVLVRKNLRDDHARSVVA